MLMTCFSACLNYVEEYQHQNHVFRITFKEAYDLVISESLGYAAYILVGKMIIKAGREKRPGYY